MSTKPEDEERGAGQFHSRVRRVAPRTIAQGSAHQSASCESPRRRAPAYASHHDLAISVYASTANSSFHR